ncbi:DUF3231 family protein [Desulfoscipio geothermicus]|nr:DUF3231 family protein [Desulfoscipio geothermicus]
MDKLQKITEFGKSTREKQRYINVGEVFHVWDILVVKWDAMETAQIFENFINDNDLKFINHQVVNALQSGINDMENLMNDYGIPFPVRPPAGNKSTIHLEFFSDKFIFQNLHEAIQTFFPILATSFMQSTTPKIRKAIKNHLLLTLELHEQIVEYGKLKGFLNEAPVYRA